MTAIIYVNTISQTISSCTNGVFVEHVAYLNKATIDECVRNVAAKCGFGTNYQQRWVD